MKRENMPSIRRAAMRVATLLAVALLGLLNPVRAEDIDIYISGAGVIPDEKPSILIIFDNSGSMSTTVPNSSEAYVSTNTYTGSYNASRLYWTTGSSCASIGSGSNQWFTASNNRCQSSLTPLNSQGFYQGDRIARWNGSNRWANLTGGNNPTNVDCKTDYDNSIADTGGLGYPRNNQGGVNGPYTTNRLLMNITWSNFNRPLLCTGNYMNYLNSPAAQNQTRIQLAKKVVKDIVDTTVNVRFGLMIFNRNTPAGSYNGGRIVSNIKDMTDANKTALKSIVDSLSASTWTPLSETLWEAYRYFAGLTVDYGDDDTSQTPARDTTAESSGTYISPFEFACQQAYIILVTDGEPTKDTSANSGIQALPGVGTCDNTGNLNTDSEHGGQCLDDLAGYMYNNDVLTTRSGNQRVITYTIRIKGATESDSGLLTETANQGGGKAYTAVTSQEITSSFQAAVSEILATTTSFAAPSLSVNAFNRLQTSSEVYFALFKPADTTQWAGNVKKFSFNTATDKVYDQLGVAAIDPQTKKLKPTACSYWQASCAEADGDNVTKGGAGAKIPARASRLIYTWTGSGAPSNVVLNVDAHKLTVANSAVTLAMLGIAASGDQTTDDTNRANRINWIRGEDLTDEDDDGVTNEDRWKFGDPLHSRPLVITYNNAIKKIFVGGNDGMLRMINEPTGVEDWAFLPKELLPLQGTLFDNLATQTPPHPQGLDGTPVAWIKDVDGDGVIEPNDGDFARVIVGQRRGGKYYYALDVTPDTDGNVFPKLMWQIEGGIAGTDFFKLGQTWSPPVITNIRFGTGSGNEATVKTVMIVGGGYESSLDKSWGKDDTNGTTVASGNAVYIIDPVNGQRLWWASRTGSGATLALANMEYSIPSEVGIYDSNGDGETDRLYVGDTGGQLWRIDLSPTLRLNTNGDSTGARLFVANGDADSTTAADNRKFFYPPAIAPVTDQTYSLDATYDLVVIGSGNREDPLNTAVHDQFYAIRDINTGIYIPSGFTPLTNTNLLDLTANINPTTGQLKGSEASHIMGWYLNMQESGGSWLGEKVLAASIILDGVVYFNTYSPADPNNNTGCTVQEGSARSYAVEALTGEPSFDRNGDGSEQVSDRYAAIGSGIPTEVVPVYHDQGVSGIIGVGGGAETTRLAKPIQAKTFWYQKTAQ